MLQEKVVWFYIPLSHLVMEELLRGISKNILSWFNISLTGNRTITPQIQQSTEIRR